MTAPECLTVPVVVVVPPQALLLDIAGPIEVLRKANMIQGRVRFDVRYVGPAPLLTSSVGLNISGIDPLPSTLSDGAIVVVSGTADEVLHTGHGRVVPTRVASEAAIVTWLAETIRPGITLVSICSGALLAGRAGLLDERECTTHFDACDALARVAPRARVVENRLFVEDGERLTSAGITAGIDLMLHLLGRYVDADCTLQVARYLVVYLRRGSSDPQLSPWMESRNHIHPVVHRVQDAVARDPARPWTLAALARIAGASPRHLSRLFSDHVGMSVVDYVNSLRVALARELLGQTRLDMERVAERAGFASSRQLRRAWARIHPSPPRAARVVRAVERSGGYQPETANE